MTVPSEQSRVQYTSDGVATSFPVPFRFLRNRDLRVTLIHADGTSRELALDADYSLTGAGQASGGTLTTTTTLPGGQTLLIERVMAITQETAYQRNDPFPERAHEQALDKLTMICQMLASIFGLTPGSVRRALLLGETDLDGRGAYRARNNRITNLGDPQTDTDAVNQRTMFSFVTGYVDRAIAGVVGGFGWFLQAGLGAVYRTFQDKMRDIVSIKDFGANGYGPGYASAAFEKAINHLSDEGGGTLFVPRGRYRLNGPIYLRSNVAVVCEEGAVFDASDSEDAEGVIKFIGSVGPEIELAQPLQRGESTIYLKEAVTIEKNQLFHLVGQRNCLSVDAGEDWRLGRGTPASLTCYFGEFLISAVEGTTNSIKINGSTIFPDYLTNKLSETDPNARPCSTIKLVDPVTRAKWVGGEFIGLAGKNTVVFSRWAYNCFAETMDVSKGKTAGSAVFWTDSLLCKAIGVKSYFDADLDYPESDHHKYNSFKTAGAQRCDFIACGSEYGAQCVDFSYLNFGTPSVDCTVRDGEYHYARSNPIITHPGVFRIRIINNECHYCQGSGINTRGRSGIITGNTVTGCTDTQTAGVSYGISTYAGYAVDNIISDNVVDGFLIGLYEWDSSNEGQQFKRSGNRWTGNTVRNAYDGARVYAHSSRKNTQPRGTIFQDNVFVGIRRSFFRTNEYCPGVIFRENHLWGPGNTSVGIFIAANCPFTVVAENSFYELNIDVASIVVNQTTDTGTYPNGRQSCEIYGNRFFGATPTYAISPAAWKPVYVEWNGYAALPENISSPIALPGYAQMWMDTDENYKIKWSDNTIARIANKT